MEQKIALVTGANRGVGLEIVKQLSDKGFIVLLTARDEQKGREAIRHVAKDETSVVFYPLDVTDVGSMDRLVLFVKEKYGRLDVLVNNAGIMYRSEDSTKVAVEEVKGTMETNFYGPLQLSQKMLPLLVNSPQGRIINISSQMGALNGMGGGYASYRFSKTAINSLTIVMAADLARTSVKVFSMCPGWVQTDMGGMGAPRSVQQGADTAVWLATSDEPISGKFYSDRKIIAW